MSNENYQYLQFQPDSQPGFLQGRYSRAFGGACGYAKDIYIEVAEDGIQARFLNVCNDDTLGYHGSERSLPWYGGIDPDNYRAWLLNAWSTWTEAGTAQGIIDNLVFAGFGAAHQIVIFENNELGLDPDLWWRFWVNIDATANPWGDPWLIGDVVSIGDTGLIIGYTDAPLNADYLVSIINAWKPAHTICVELNIFNSGWFIGQTHPNGTPFVIGGNDDYGNALTIGADVLRFTL